MKRKLKSSFIPRFKNQRALKRNFKPLKQNYMGNPDLVFIFNEVLPFTIKGIDYQNNEDAVKKALIEYYLKKQCALANYKDACVNTPERVVKDYDIDNEWEITSIKIYKL